jgi:hypothetical protein
MKTLNIYQAVFLFIVLGSGLVLAQPDLVFRQSAQIDLKIPCVENGQYCTPSAICNLTIRAPGEFIVVDNKQMTNQGAFHNYTLDGQQTITLGDYPSAVICVDGNNTGFNSFTIGITPAGVQEREGQFPLEVLFLFASYVLVMVGIKNTEWKMFKTLGGILMMVMGVYTLYPGYGTISHETLVGLAVGTISIGFGAYAFIADSFSYSRQVDHFDQRNSGRDEE